MSPNSDVPTGECAARLVWDPRFMGYDFGPQHPLRPERFTSGLDLLKESQLWRPETETLEPPMAERSELELVHGADFIEAVERLGGGEAVDPRLVAIHGLGSGDNPAFPGMHEAAAL